MIKVIAIFLLSLSAYGSVCDSFKDDIPVLASGRVKPYFVLAKESVKFLTGKSKFNKESPSVTFCRLMLQTRTNAQLSFPILVEHIDTKKLLGLTDADKSMSSTELTSKKMLIRSEIFKQKENNSYKKDLNKLYTRIDVYENIVNGNTFTLYTGVDKNDGAHGWRPLKDYTELSDQDFLAEVQKSKDLYIQKQGDGYQLELTYVKSNIFSWSMLVALIGIFLTVILKDLKWGVITSILTLLVQVVGMTMRVLISGRAPITNMYETVMFSGFGALVIALIILYYHRDKIYIIAGLGYNILCLFMMMFANNMLNPSISPLVPVLRDNFWLSTHVTTIILSYAALALSWIVANITLYKKMMNKLEEKDYRYYQSLTYSCIKVGIVLLAAGIILGGVWADYSWGRFWGWDPKETWSLIVLLFYMVLVHGRYSSWINTHRFIMASAAGFMTVMMAWFGVNYILASGLHSYGFSEGGAIFLGSFFAIQTAFLVIVEIREKARANA